MKKLHLKKPHLKHLRPQLKFPSITRFIPDLKPDSLTKRIKYLQKTLQRKSFLERIQQDTIGLVSFLLLISLLLVLGIGIVGVDVYRTAKQKYYLESERMKLSKQVSYWKQVISKYQNYRDGYLQLALLEYQLGNSEQAKMYVNKALELDPNFEQGKELERILRK